MDEVIKEAAEKGESLRMTVMHAPPRLPGFLKQEGLEATKDKCPTKATVLHRAVRRCDFFIIEELCRNREDTLGNGMGFEQFDARDNRGQTALHVAATCGFLEAAEALLQCPSFKDVGAKDT